MEKCSIAELERVAKEYNADIIIAQEIGIENSEKRETDTYIFWTASDNKNERKQVKMYNST